MANVLGELFLNIANAIREKTGDTAAIKPADMPELIGGITTGASVKVKYEMGYITGDCASEYTVSHSLGTVPDAVFMVYTGYAPSEDDSTGVLLWSYGFSDKFQSSGERVGKYDMDLRYTSWVGNSSMGMVAKTDITNDDSWQAIRNATDTAITFGSKFRPFGLWQYQWYAFSFYE